MQLSTTLVHVYATCRQRIECAICVQRWNNHTYSHYRSAEYKTLSLEYIEKVLGRFRVKDDASGLSFLTNFCS